MITISLLILRMLYWLAVPLSRNDNAVRTYFLEQIMPIGTSWDEANTIITENNWMIPAKSENQGVVLDVPSHRPIITDYNPKDLSKTCIGAKNIYCYFGQYYNPFTVSVKAALAFDENDRLIEVIIEKETDLL